MAHLEILFSSFTSMITSGFLQENRREYEKRVASIVEQSWLIFSEEAEGKEEGKTESSAD